MRTATPKPQIIPGVYGDSIITPDRGSRSEPTARDRKDALDADRVSTTELTTTYHVTAAELEQWVGKFGFPKPTTCAFRRSLFSVSREPLYSRSAIAAWQREILSIAARLQ
jgi:hypothetical protein